MTHPLAQAFAACPAAPFGGAVVAEVLAGATSARTLPDPRDLEQHRRDMVRHATWLLGNRAAAEDAVQDTLVAALGALPSFTGRSSLRTWLFGILRHKVTDTFRRQVREVPLEDDHDGERDDEGMAFNADGGWRMPVSNWGDPEAALSQKRFFETLARCIDRLPKNAARVFAMREILGMETQEICDTVGITKENCFVMLYRARVALRDRLERDWFDGRAVQ
jgi:RNA polymerase sigma-70 factor, ECF subfamily